MDETTLLRDHAPAVVPPDPAVLRAARAALVDAAREQRVRPVVAAPRRRRPRRRVVVALGALAVAAAVGVGVLVAPTATIGDRAPVARAGAAEILLQAATVARAEPVVVPRADQFVYVDAPGLGARLWLSVDGTHDGLRVGDDGLQIPLPGCRGGVTEVGGNQQGARPRPCTVTPAYQPDLPTDADGMAAYLAGGAGGDIADPAAVNRVGKLVQDLLSSTYLTPAQRAAVFEAVARIPGLTVAVDATGPGGEHGTAVSWQGPTAGESAVLLFDPATDTLDAFYTRADDGTLGGGLVGVPRIVDQPGLVP